MEAMTQPDHSAFLRICVPALRPCRMGPAEAPIKVDQTKSNRFKPATWAGDGGGRKGLASKTKMSRIGATNLNFVSYWKSMVRLPGLWKGL